MRAALFGAILLSGCATGGLSDRADVSADLAELREFTLADAKRALAKAEAANSLMPATCLRAIVPWLEARRQAESLTAPGPRGAIELTVDLWLAAHPPAGRSDEIKVACDAWVIAMTRDQIRLGIGVAGAVGSGGASAVTAMPKVVRLLRALGAGP